LQPFHVCRRVVDVRSEVSVSTSSLFDRALEQVLEYTRPPDFSRQLQIVRQSERILGRRDNRSRPASKFFQGSIHESKRVLHRSIFCVERLQLCPKIKFKQFWKRSCFEPQHDRECEPHSHTRELVIIIYSGCD
jgi:hypothetical protein